MKWENFIAENGNKRIFKILRDYAYEDDKVSGILFIGYNESDNEVDTFLLESDKINGVFQWEEFKKNGIDYIASGIEYGDNVIVIETGTLEGQKRNSIGQWKPVKARAMVYRYCLKEKA